MKKQTVEQKVVSSQLKAFFERVSGMPKAVNVMRMVAQLIIDAGTLLKMNQSEETNHLCTALLEKLRYVFEYFEDIDTLKDDCYAIDRARKLVKSFYEHNPELIGKNLLGICGLAGCKFCKNLLELQKME